MPNVKGITTKKNEEGKITHVTIDVEEYKDVISPMLYELGVMEKKLLKKSVKMVFLPKNSENIYLQQ